MKHLLYLFFLLLTIVSCRDNSYPVELVMADSAYMRGNYPLADSLLASYEPNIHHESEAVKNYHLLLQMEKQFVQSDITEEHFSSIDSLCRYYAKNDSREKYAKALMFQGESYYATKDYPNALENYLKASETAQAANETTLLGLTYKLQGKVYFAQRMFKDGADCHRKALAIAQSCNDTLRIIHAALYMGKTYTYENKIDSIHFIYQYARNLIQSFPYAKHMMPVLNWRIADIYIQTEEYEKALPYLTHDSFFNDCWAFWHYGQNHNDSAIYYFEKGLANSTLYGKEENLRYLIQLEKGKKHYTKALEYADSLIKVEDFIKSTSKVDETREMAAQHSLNLVKQERNELEIRHQSMVRIMYVSVVAFVFLLLTIIYAWRNYKQRSRELLLQERWLRMSEAEKLRKSLKQLEQNQAQIESLEQQLSQARLNNDITSVDELELRKEILQEEIRNIEAEQRHQALMKKQLENSQLYQKIRLNAGKEDFHLSTDDWKEVAYLIDKAYNNFTTRLISIANLNEYELKICYLIKLEVASAHIALILFKSKSAITMTRQRLYKKILKQNGTPTQLNTFIKEF